MRLYSEPIEQYPVPRFKPGDKVRLWDTRTYSAVNRVPDEIAAAFAQQVIGTVESYRRDEPDNYHLNEHAYLDREGTEYAQGGYIRIRIVKVRFPGIEGDYATGELACVEDDLELVIENSDLDWGSP